MYIDNWWFNPKLLIKLLVLGFLIAFAVIIADLVFFNNDLTEYPQLKTSDFISGIVKVSKDYQGVAYIETKENDKFRIDYSVNYLNEPIYLHKFIQVGDSMHKPKNVDTVSIFRNGKEYYFILGKIINEQ